MASVFGHCVLGATLGKLLLPNRQHWPYWVLAAGCAFLPDADVIGFKLQVPYASMWGHRGISHSLFAAGVVALLLTGLLQLKPATPTRPSAARLGLLLFLATASHGVLDAMTTGGLGVAFYSPFQQERYFFDLRSIRVSPIGIKNFIGPRGALVLLSEVKWVLLPCLVLLFTQRLLRTRPPQLTHVH